MANGGSKKQVKIACSNCGQHLDVTAQEPFSRVECPTCNTRLLVPMIIGSYHLLNPIGGGGMGTVYKAFDGTLQRFVAVKLMKKELASNQRFVADFTREARAAAALSHPNIAQILSFGQLDGQYYLVMELLEGGSLDHMIETRKRVPEKEVIEIGVQVASALRAAHQKGVIHRDIKPGNILFDAEGQAKVVDFGLAQFGGEEDKRQEEDGIWGTPYYIAPEKLNHEREDFRSDIYSLGGTLFHALAGRAPFEANTATEVVLKHLKEPALSLKTFAPDVSTETAQVIGQMLNKNPADRFDSYDELIAALKHAAQAAVVHQRQLAIRRQQRPAGVVVTAPGEPSMSWASVIGTLVVLAACIACAVLIWTHREKLFGKSTQRSKAASQMETPTTTVPALENWLDLWDAADRSLTEGKYKPAIDYYHKAAELLIGDPTKRSVVLCQLGLLSYLTGKPEDARKQFDASAQLAASVGLSEKITRDNYGIVLGQLMSGGLEVGSVEPKLKKDLPGAWPLAQLYMGARALSDSKFTEAAALLGSYASASVDGELKWVTLFQPHVKKLSAELAVYLKGVEEIKALVAASNGGEAAKKLAALKTRTKSPVLLSALAPTEEEVKKLTDFEGEVLRAQQRRDAFEAEKGTLAQLDAAIPPLVAEYDFAAAAKVYADAAGKLKSPEIKQVVQDRAQTYQRLVALKGHAIRGIGKTPYERGDLTSRRNERLTGKVTKADDTNITLTQPQGEVTVPWRDLSPVALLTLFTHYDPTDPLKEPAARANNFLSYAWVSRDLQFPQFVPSYLEAASKSSGEAKAEWDRLNAPPQPPPDVPGAKPSDTASAQPGAKAAPKAKPKGIELDFDVPTKKK